MYLKLCKLHLNRNQIKLANYIRNYHSDRVFGFTAKSKSSYLVPDQVLENRNRFSNFYRLVEAYRKYAHKTANINPVCFTKQTSILPQLNWRNYDLKDDEIVKFNGIINTGNDDGTILEAVEFLDQIYNKTAGVEFTHLEDEEEIEWFAGRIEELIPQPLDNETKLLIVTEMLKSQNFDNYLANKFPGVKRYGGEGAESMMAFFRKFFDLSIADNLEQIVVAMPHRGRLNLLTGMLNFRPIKIFAKLNGKSDFPTKYQVTGDVLSHFISSTDLNYNDKNLHVTMLYNPSHLEVVNPVSMGKTRAKQLTTKDGDYSENSLNWSDKILNLQVHGDAAIIGQGVNQECLALSNTPHFNIGGTVHLVVNNQVGFTTPSDRGRSSRYCTDLAKIISSPVIHVNGDDPEMVSKMTQLTFEYQRRFRKDIFLDLNCYRQWGHNEMDDPTITNPALYRIIKNRDTIPNKYADKLIEDGVLTEEYRRDIIKSHTNWLNEHLKIVDKYEPEDVFFKKQWLGISQAEENVTTWDTGIDIDLMTFIGGRSLIYPQDFNIHPNLLKTHIKPRLNRIAEGASIDWATAEALAIGSLLYEGYNVRISGQDVGRGTFSHRHVMLVDQETNQTYIPLNNLHNNQTGFLEVANSILSEEAVLGYEYGMSVENPDNLVIWEAQFGDFFNGAQIIFDTFITTGEDKWLWSSGLVVLLPHGYDGAGPEHSSSRIERFLQLTNSNEAKVDGDNINMEVCQPSTPAQYFHLLRRQIVRNYRKPLIIIAPKTLLRLSDCVSKFSEMTPKTTYQPVIGDCTDIDPIRIERVLLTSGKHYYTLNEKRNLLNNKDTAIIRLESYCPFPTLFLQQEITKFPNAKVFVWCQEEPRNMGAWTFIKPRFQNLIGRQIKYCGRPTQAAPAVGIGKVHLQQVNDITTKPFTIKHYNQV